MTDAHGLLFGAIAAGFFMPRLLDRVDLLRRDPVLLIACWLLSMAGVLLSTLGCVILLLLPHNGQRSALTTLLHCWDEVQHRTPQQVDIAGGLLGAALVGATAVRIVVVGRRICRSRAIASREHAAILRSAARVVEGSPRTLWLSHDQPMAFSLAGRPGVVVATEALTRHLTPEAVAAVLEHERAHLRHKHHLLISVIDALSAVLVFVPLFRQAPATIRALVELAADATAARSCGAAAVQAALLGVAQHGVPGSALAMAREAIDIRLARLRRSEVVLGGQIRRTMSRGAAGAAAVLVPFVIATSLLIAVGLVGCLAMGA
jgi:hypothetical protein